MIINMHSHKRSVAPFPGLIPQHGIEPGNETYITEFALLISRE